MDTNKPEDINRFNTPALAWGRWVFLGAFSTLLCQMMMTIFAPVPLVIAYLSYGRYKGILLGVMFTAVLYLLYLNSYVYYLVPIGFFISFVYASLITEIFVRKMSPIGGLLRTGIILLLVIAVIIGIYSLASEVPLMEQMEKMVSVTVDNVKERNAQLLKRGGEDARALEEYLISMQSGAKLFSRYSLSFFFASVFLGLWINLGLVLWSSKSWRKDFDYPYYKKDLFKFRSPDMFVWPLLVGLILTLGGTYIYEPLVTIGINVLICICVFFFFQGFGVLLDFLSFVKIIGFFRSALILVVIMWFWHVIVIIGVFDLWVNFRKFFKRKEGDMR